jgi:large subunit ribosomal protein L5
MATETKAKAKVAAKPATPAKKVETKKVDAKPAAKKIITKSSPRLKKQYRTSIAPSLNKKFKYDSVMEIPKLDKIVINMGVGRGIANKSNITDAAIELAAITGQKPSVTIAKKSLAAFKLREGMPVGQKVTLRGDNMYFFIDKLITISLPRVRDFRGLNTKAFDGRGNYSLGIKEHIVFPEIDFDKVKLMKGCDITITTTAKTNEEAFELLKLLGMPFKVGGVN